MSINLLFYFELWCYIGGFLKRNTCAREVLAAGPRPQPMLETVIITLMHISIYSEEVELEVYVLPFHLFIYLDCCFM